MDKGLTVVGEQGEHQDQLAAGRPVRRHDGGWVGSAIAIGLLVAFLMLGLLSIVGPLWRSPPPVVSGLILVLPYLFSGFLCVSFAVWIAVPDRGLVGAITGLCALLMVGLWGPGWSAKGDATVAGTEVRVMSYNVRRLWGDPFDEKPAKGCVVDVVQQEEPDVLTLLEVSQDNLDQLETDLEMSCIHSPYHAATATDVGGLAVCVRGDAWRLAGGKPMRYRDQSDWHYVFSEVESNGHVLNVLAVHLYPYAVPTRGLRGGATWLDVGRSSADVVREQGAQSTALLDRVARFRDPSVLAGDFNSTRDFALHRSLRDHLTDAWEHGGFGFGSTVDLLGWLPLRIDYVYATEEFEVIHSRVPAAACSDHRPVVADLVLRD